MLDAALVRERMDDVRRGLASRGLEPEAELQQLADLEARRRQMIPEIEGLKREQNAAADAVARAKRAGEDASPIFAANKARGQQIKQLEARLDEV
jgi:seryl-tRNA synthetase